MDEPGQPFMTAWLGFYAVDRPYDRSTTPDLNFFGFFPSFGWSWFRNIQLGCDFIKNHAKTGDDPPRCVVWSSVVMAKKGVDDGYKGQ